MTVRELMERLVEARCPDQIVYLSRDGEGNGFRPLRGLSVEALDEHGERQAGEPNAVCLWPTY
jgi:hypothetical protein